MIIILLVLLAWIITAPNPANYSLFVISLVVYAGMYVQRDYNEPEHKHGKKTK
jgi:hypothetical protein